MGRRSRASCRPPASCGSTTVHRRTTTNRAPPTIRLFQRTMSSPEGSAATSVGALDLELDRALATVVRGSGRSGVSLEQLWRAAIAVDPDLASSVDRRQRLADSVDRLVASG